MSSRAQQSSSYFPPCDQCLYRKIRCDKSLPRCHRCFDANLACTRDVVRRRPGRKKGSGLVIARLRSHSTGEDQTWIAKGRPTGRPLGSQRDMAIEGAEADPAGRGDRGARGGPRWVNVDGFPMSGLSTDDFVNAQSHRPAPVSPQPVHHDSPTHRISSYEPMAVISNLPELSRQIDLFFTELYPIWPIIHESSFRQSLNHPAELDHHQTCLILSICALTALHIPGSTSPAPEPRRVIAMRFIEQCLQIRASFDYIGTATLCTIQTSLFLSCAEVEFQRARAAWFLLREAIMLAQELGFYEAKGPSTLLNQQTAISLQRTLYILSLAEHGLTVLRNKPFTIILFDAPPEEPLEGEDPRILVGLRSLSRLFNLLDRQFLDTWVNGTESAPESEGTARSQAIVKILKAQETLARMHFEVDNLTDAHKADILITQQWLRIVFWQSSMRQGLLSSVADDQALTYQFPCEVAKSLSAALQSLPIHAILIHGMAMFERIFEIAYSFIDSLSLSHTLASGLEELRVLFRVLRDSPNSHDTYIQILEEKLMEQAGEESKDLIPLLEKGTMRSL